MKFKLTTFGLLLSLLVLGEAQSDCTYYQRLELGKTYYIYHPNYPNSYYGRNNCKWRAESRYNIKINCTVNMPRTDNCNQDALSLQFDGKNVDKYCGNGEFVLTGQNLTVYFDSMYYTQGGKFLCAMQTETFDDYCYCGWRNPTYIVGGKETGVNEFPMMAGLVDGERKLLYCGATIISNQHVVTAAHCVSGRDPSMIGVVVGEHDITTGHDTPATKLYRINRCMTHPYYYDTRNDIAVCQIIGTIIYNARVGPACLPFRRRHESFNGQSVNILGWGLKEFGGAKSNTLQGVQVGVISNQECMRIYGNEVTANHMCTYASRKDSCQMDSGGPVLWQDPQSYNLVLTGVIIGGIGCASPNKPSLNTRIGPYIDWIKSVTPGVQYCQAS